MKIQDAIEIRNSRKNLMAFLHHSDISTIESLLNEDIECKPVVWNTLCDQVLKSYKEGKIKNKNLSKIFEILLESNTKIRTEKYRYETNMLFKYSISQNVYLFEKPCSRKEFNFLYANTYID